MAAKVDKAAVLAALKPKQEPYPIEGVGPVFVRQLSVTEVDGVRASIQGRKEGDPDTFGLRLVLMSVVDEDGTAIFGEQDLPLLSDSSNVAMDALVGRTLEFNGFRKKDDAKN